MKNRPTTIKELCEFIWYLEEKYDLLDFKVDGVKVWQYARMQLYYKLAQSCGILSQAHSQLNKLDKIQHLFSYLKNSCTDNYFSLKQKDIVFFSHPRVVNVDGEFIDIYTKYFIDEIMKKEENIIELESVHLGEHKKKKQKFSHYTDWIAFVQRIYKFFIKVNITNNKLELISSVQNEINDTCRSNFDLIAFITTSVKTYKGMYFIYNKIFQKIKPKVFYTVVSYGQAAIIKAAKDNNVEVIELQHGTFSKYHLGYSFPNRITPLEYFPDKFLVWNDYWKNLIRLPLLDKNIKVDKFRYMEREKLKFSSFEKKNKQLVVLSQGAIGNEMAKKFLEHSEKFKDYSIMYKLHPGEFERWGNYPFLVKLSKLKNVKIIKNEIPLYELFATSELQIGVFSTALYEGVEFGCKTILLDVNGIEYMDEFITVNNVELLG